MFFRSPPLFLRQQDDFNDDDDEDGFNDDPGAAEREEMMRMTSGAMLRGLTMNGTLTDAEAAAAQKKLMRLTGCGGLAGDKTMFGMGLGLGGGGGVGGGNPFGDTFLAGGGAGGSRMMDEAALEAELDAARLEGVDLDELEQ